MPPEPTTQQLQDRRVRLEERVDALRQFEREFRSGLRSFHESLLSSLAADRPVDLDEAGFQLQIFYSSQLEKLRHETSAPAVAVPAGGGHPAGDSSPERRLLIRALDDREAFQAEYSRRLEGMVRDLMDRERRRGRDSFAQAAAQQFDGSQAHAFVQARLAALP